MLFEIKNASILLLRMFLALNSIKSYRILAAICKYQKSLKNNGDENQMILSNPFRERAYRESYFLFVLE